MKKRFCLLLALLMILPITAFPVSADYSDWLTLGAKYSSSTYQIIALKKDDYEIKSDGFEFTCTDNGGLSVVTPDYKSFSGAYAVSALCSKRTLPLDGLCIVIEPDEFDFTLDENGVSNQFSVLWTDKPVTEIAGGLTDRRFTTGLYDSDRVWSGGLRNIVAADTKGLCITLTSLSAKTDKRTADTLRITYYDGSYSDEKGNIGHSWVFSKKPSGDIMPLDLDTEGDTPYEEIEINYGVVINIRADRKFGYIVNVNGKDYYGENAGFKPKNMSDIDLIPLKDISRGYITVGAVSNEDKLLDDHSCNYTLSSINTMAPCEVWDNEPVAHVHSYNTQRTEPTCTDDGSVVYVCDCGYSYSTTIPANGHTKGREVETTPGYADVYCLICGEYMYTKTVFIPHPHFDDVQEGHWFYYAVSYVTSKGYMYGMNETSFSPNTELTREQFVTILANIAGIDKDAYRNEQLMSDVKPDYWFAGPVNWAVKEGYVAGVSEGVFGKGQPIQRAALARLLYLYAEKNGKQTDKKADLSVYTDFDKVQEWMVDGLGWAVEHGVITSIKDNELVLAPTSTATRAQCARMLTVYDKVPNAEAKSVVPEITPEYRTDSEPLLVDTEALKQQLIRTGNKNALGDYCFKTLDMSVAYDEENDELYALRGATIIYYFGGDRVEILGPGKARPLFEIYGDYELLLPYQETKGYAKMTADGIIGAPEEYKSICDDFYNDLIDMLEMLDML